MALTFELVAGLRSAAPAHLLPRSTGLFGHRTVHEERMPVSKLEKQLEHLLQQEQDLKRGVEGLQNVPSPAAEYFAQLADKEMRMLEIAPVQADTAADAAQ